MPDTLSETMAHESLHRIIPALRRVRRRPASAIGIVLALALGIGISSSMFAVLNGVVLRSLPFPDSDRIVRIQSEHSARSLLRSLSPAEAVEGLPGAAGFEQTAYAQSFGAATVIGYNGPKQLPIRGVSRGYFSVFGVQAALGRTFVGGDFGAAQSAVLSHEAWQVLGGSTDIIGGTIEWESSTLEVVGVLPPSFELYSEPTVYIPFDGQRLVGADTHRLQAFGRLAPGASIQLAENGLRARFTAVNEAYGQSEEGWRPLCTRLLNELVGDVRGVLLALFAISLLVLLTACSTTASLVSIRLDQRKREFAVRRALGASHGRFVADVGVELLLLAALAVSGGIWLAYAATATIEPLAAGSLPRADGIGIDAAVLAFAVAAAVISIAISAVPPLVNALGSDSAECVQGSAREVEGGRRVSWLPAASIALSTVAVLVALALSVSLIRLGDVEPGVRTEGIRAVALVRQSSVLDVFVFLDSALEAARAIPGVSDAVAVLAGAPSAQQMLVAELGANGERFRGGIQAVSAGYHRFFDIPLLRGRDIDERDRAGAPRVAVVNETLARQAFGDADPIGRFVTLPLFGEDLPHEVIGIAEDRRNAGLHAPTEPEIVISLHQWDAPAMTLLLDWPNAPATWVQTVEEKVWEVNPTQAVSSSYTLSEHLEQQLRPLRFFAAATAWFAALALLLCSIGINAVIAAMQRRRTREIGLRIALGAARRDASTLVLGAAAKILVTGLVIGLALATAALQVLRDRLFEVEGPALWALLSATALVLIVCGLAAVCWPVWRASRIEPMVALRAE